MVGFGTGGDPGQMEQEDAIAKEFNDSHKDIQIEFLYVNHEEATDKFGTLIASDQAPDIVMPVGIAGMNSYVDQWLDLAPYITRDDYDTSDYIGPAVDIVKTEGYGTLGMPIGVYPTVVYYNADLFDAAGVDYPPHQYGDATWTYDKVAEIARKLTLDTAGNNADSPDFQWEDTSQWGWAGWGGQFQMVVEHWGANPLGMSKDYKTAEFTDPRWVEASQWYYDSIWTWHIRPTEDQNSPYSWDTFSAGKSAMLENFSWQSWAWGDWQGSFKWDVAAVPMGPHGDVVSPTNADVMAIPAKAKHPDQSWEVIKWMSQPDVMNRLCKIYGCVPARKSLADGWVADRSAEYPGVDFQVFINSIEHLDANPNVESWMPNWSDVFDAIGTFDSGMQTGEVTNIQDALNTLDTSVQAILDTYWADQ
jgi:multiple sugar transport system substrate-binding protein